VILLLLSWRWVQQIPLTCQYLPITLHVITSQKSMFLTVVLYIQNMNKLYITFNNTRFLHTAGFSGRMVPLFHTHRQLITITDNCCDKYLSLVIWSCADRTLITWQMLYFCEYENQQQMNVPSRIRHKQKASNGMYLHVYELISQCSKAT
jgi:hypothetical protein